MRIVKWISWEIIYILRKFYEFIFAKSDIDTDQSATVILQTFSPERLKNVKRQVDLLIKCSYIDRIIISNNNPIFRIEEYLDFGDDRVVFINQPEKRGCGYRWKLLINYELKFILSFDDDILLFPSQMGTIVSRLVENPEVPHGISGSIDSNFVKGADNEVDYLYQLYAITYQHLKRYILLENEVLIRNPSLRHAVEFFHDYLLISNTGAGKPKIHNVGIYVQDPTTSEPGIALYKSIDFNKEKKELENLIDEIINEDIL
jgi:hypothetical protein